MDEPVISHCTSCLRKINFLIVSDSDRERLSIFFDTPFIEFSLDFKWILILVDCINNIIITFILAVIDGICKIKHLSE
jgi:hypothetical protein